MVDSIVQIVSTVGFPIACCVVMFAMWDKERDAHDTEVKEITKAINTNDRVRKGVDEFDNCFRCSISPSTNNICHILRD